MDAKEVSDPFPLAEDAYFDRTPVKLVGVTVVETTPDGAGVRVRVAKHLGFKEADVLIPKLEFIKATPADDSGDASIYVTAGFARRNNLPTEAE